MELLERQPFIDTFRRLLDQAADGRGSLAIVAGEAGVGKSSLVTHFGRLVDGSARVHFGACDALSTPRPLGPLQDIAASAQGAIAGAVRGGSGRDEIFQTLLHELTDTPVPLLLVIEDAQWADDVTLDLLRYLGRRIGGTRSLVLATYRDDEVGSLHPLRSVLGDLATSPDLHRSSLPRLSETGVRALIGDRNLDPAHMYRLTGGNPFFVTEILAGEGDGIPETVKDAVLTRAARLTAQGRAALSAAAILGSPMEPWVLAAVAMVDTSAIDECIERGMLIADHQTLSFRHELARQAILGTTSPSQTIALHARALNAMLAIPGADRDPARLAHHAEGARDRTAVLEHAVEAARHAEAMGAHRLEAAQYARAIRFAGDLDARERACLFEAYSYALYLTNEWVDGKRACEAAIELWRQDGNRLKEGENLRWLSRFAWLSGQSAEARHIAKQALDVLKPLGDETQLARSYSTMAQLSMLVNANDDAIAWGEKAITLARKIGDTQSLVDALNNIGSVKLCQGQDEGRRLLVQSLRTAEAAGLTEHAGRAFCNLVSSSCNVFDFATVDQYIDEGMTYCANHDLDTYHAYLVVHRGVALMHTGDWTAATETVASLAFNPASAPVDRIPALYTIGRVRARRGDPEVWSALDEALALAMTTGELQRIGPVRAARAEAAWLAGDPEQAISEARAAYDMAITAGKSWLAGEYAFWLWRAGAPDPIAAIAAEPYTCQIHGDWARAAELWQARGCSYEAARARVDACDERVMRLAWAELDRLGAKPELGILGRRMRALGLPVPRGPRLSTRANPALLTARELEVLKKIAVHESNAEIAQHLYLSPKTVEHHISAILSKLQVSTRGQALVEAERRNLISQNGDHRSLI